MSDAATSRSWPRLEDADATRAAGAALAAVLQPGDMVALSGPLGAGKSDFARAAIRSLAGDANLEAPSPSYTLVQTYETPRGEVWHADLYRLTDPEEAVDLGLIDAVDEAILLVEWAERLAALAPPRRLEVTLSAPDPSEPGRRISWRAVGDGWAPALAVLERLHGRA